MHKKALAVAQKLSNNLSIKEKIDEMCKLNHTKGDKMSEEQARDLKEQILDMEDKLDEFVEQMQARIIILKNSLHKMEQEKPKAKDYER